MFGVFYAAHLFMASRSRSRHPPSSSTAVVLRSSSIPTENDDHSYISRYSSLIEVRQAENRKTVAGGAYWGQKTHPSSTSNFSRNLHPTPPFTKIRVRHTTESNAIDSPIVMESLARSVVVSLVKRRTGASSNALPIHVYSTIPTYSKLYRNHSFLGGSSLFFVLLLRLVGSLGSLTPLPTL